MNRQRKQSRDSRKKGWGFEVYWDPRSEAIKR